MESVAWDSRALERFRAALLSRPARAGIGHSLTDDSRRGAADDRHWIKPDVYPAQPLAGGVGCYQLRRCRGRKRDDGRRSDRCLAGH